MTDADLVYGGAVTEVKAGGASGTLLGDTRGGVEITRSSSVFQRRTDQSGVLSVSTLETEMHVRLGFAEIKASRMAYGWNISQSRVDGSSLAVTDPDDNVINLYIKAPGPTGKDTYMDAARAFAAGDSTMTFNRDADLTLDVDFSLQLDTSNPVRYMDFWHA